ncbi:phosphatidylserine decarboxylase [Bacteriovoracaceae bacterium]|nr:phosphatidylserine decarboxylase [Bacteriovoracaceae bacterium]
MYEIKYIDRRQKKQKVEKVYGDALINFFYSNKLGKNFTRFFISSPISKIVGRYHDTKKSAKKIPQFIKDFNIPMNEYVGGSLADRNIEESYSNFNEFFIRQFKPEMRKFSTEELGFCTPAEARYFAYKNINQETAYPVKGEYLDPKKILSNSKYAEEFDEGPLIIARLCPVDYHRYHYMDDGITIESYQDKGKLHSVNPLALKSYPQIFIENEKRVSILETKNFGLLAYIEVGAMCVGKIVQTSDESKAHRRGGEKGYFLFGASTVIIIGQKNKFKIDQDIIENTKNNIETYCQLGERIGEAIVQS